MSPAVWLELIVGHHVIGLQGVVAGIGVIKEAADVHCFCFIHVKEDCWLLAAATLFLEGADDRPHSGIGDIVGAHRTVGAGPADLHVSLVAAEGLHGRVGGHADSSPGVTVGQACVAIITFVHCLVGKGG